MSTLLCVARAGSYCPFGSSMPRSCGPGSSSVAGRKSLADCFCTPGAAMNAGALSSWAALRANFSALAGVLAVSDSGSNGSGNISNSSSAVYALSTVDGEAGVSDASAASVAGLSFSTKVSALGGSSVVEYRKGGAAWFSQPLPASTRTSVVFEPLLNCSRSSSCGLGGSVSVKSCSASSMYQSGFGCSNAIDGSVAGNPWLSLGDARASITLTFSSRRTIDTMKYMHSFDCTYSWCQWFGEVVLTFDGRSGAADHSVRITLKGDKNFNSYKFVPVTASSVTITGTGTRNGWVVGNPGISEVQFLEASCPECVTHCRTWFRGAWNGSSCIANQVIVLASS